MEHPKEEVYRIRQAIQTHFIDWYYSAQNKRISKNRFIFKKDSCNYSIENLSKVIDTSQNFTTFKVYDCEINDITNINNWRKDFKHNIESPIMLSSIISPQNFKLIGDIRFVSVISRLHHFPCLLAKALVDEDEKIINTIYNQLLAWKAQNPYLKSINWKSGIEVGIRVVNLILTRKLLELSKNDTTAFKDSIDELIKFHFKYLISHLSLFSSANNHLIAELMGIYIICRNYQFKNQTHYKKNVYKHLLDELLKQTYKDGFTKEQSTHYHTEVLNYYLTLLPYFKSSNHKLPKAIDERIVNMGDFLCYLMNEKNKPLQIGDSDEGELIHPYFDNRYSIYGSISTDLALSTNQNGYLSYYGRFDLRNYLINGDKGYKQYQTLSKSIQTLNLKKSKLFKESGYCIIKDKFAKIIFDIGNIGLGKLAAHGHSDLLHFVLEVDDEPIIVDTGTYQYHSRHQKWRNYFRGIYGHNTISVNNLNHAKIGGRMLWLNHPNVSLISFEDCNNFVECEAMHNAFKKQGVNVIHKRKIRWNKKDFSIHILDSLESDERYKMEFMLHFHPNVIIEKYHDNILLTNSKKRKIKIKNTYFQKAKLIKGDTFQPLGWYSNKFNNKVPIHTLKLDLSLENNFSMSTNIYLEI